MLCYQCGQCSASCPMADYMDLIPSRVMKMLQLGMVDDVFKANTMWICATCLKCSVMCPKDIDVAAVMEALRQIVLRRNEEYLSLGKISKDRIEELPQIALIASARKMTP
ncbi:MAG: heterodisulfide reductase [Thermoplasmata archaeon]|nr:MAG: heterodisulfide reductase [Thermoplasmata archaeon]